MTELDKKIEDAIWVARELFERGKATGSSANLSFLHDGAIYITGSGTCFGRLTKESFSKVSWDGEVLNGVKNFLCIKCIMKNRTAFRLSYMFIAFMQRCIRFSNRMMLQILYQNIRRI